ncbi:MAG: hypothetical protein ACRDXX_19045 [Stackebrandtia sp.]
MTGGKTRRAATAIAAAASIALLPGPAAAEEDSEPGEALCEVGVEGLGDISGLAAAEDGGYYAVSDSTNVKPTQVEVFKLDESCQQVETIVGADASIVPADMRDLAATEDGSLWVADTGNLDADRPTGALHRLQLDGAVTRYRLSFPGDVPHAEALLMQPDGTPIVASKEPGQTTLYAPAAELTDGVEEGQAVEEIGVIELEASETAGGPAEEDANQIVGGAVSPKGDRVVLRTYTDAYEWKVEDGDVAAALTGDDKPTVTALPEEQSGTAITYTGDGKFTTASKGVQDDAGNYTQPSLTTYEAASSGSSGSGESSGDKKESKDESGGGMMAFAKKIINALGSTGILVVIACVALLGAAMVAIGIWVIMRHRRRRREAEDGDGPDDDFDERDRRDERPLPGRPLPGRGRDFEEDDRYYDEPPSRFGRGREDEYDDEPPSRFGRGRGHHDDYDDEPPPRYRDDRGGGAVYGGGRPEGRSGDIYDHRDEGGSGAVYGGRGSRY